MASRFISLPERAPVPSVPVRPLALSPSPSKAKTLIVRASWNSKDRSPLKEDLQKYLSECFIIRRTRVEMRLSRRSAFIVCDREEDAEQIAQVKPTKVAGIKVHFSLVPRSSLDEDYSCSVLVFGVQLSQRGDQEMTIVSLIEEALDSSLDVVFSRENGDYDVLIVSAEIALIFVDERRKEQLGSLAGNFSYPGVMNRCAPHLKAFKLSRVPMKYQKNIQALYNVFAQWKPEIVLREDTAVITIVDPSRTVMGEVRACCESVVGQLVSIECPAELRDELASGTVSDVTVESLPQAKLAYYSTIRKHQNVSVHVDQGVMHIMGPKHSCMEYKRTVEATSLHTLDSTLDPEVVRFLSSTPAKERLAEMAKSCQCVCLESELSSSKPKLTIVSESEAGAITCKDKLKRKHTVVSIDSPHHAVLHKDAKDEWECIEACFKRQTPGVQILLEGNTVKLVGEQKDIDVIKEDVQWYISQFSMTDETVKLSSDRFEVMEHSSKWREITDLATELGCNIIVPELTDLAKIRVRGKPENVQRILDRINQLQKSLIAKVVCVDKAGIQKVSLSDNCKLLSTPSSSCTTLITCERAHLPATCNNVPQLVTGGVQLLSDVFFVEGGKISSQAADVLVNSTTEDINLRNGQIAPDLAAVAGPALERECARYVKDHGPVTIDGIAVTGAGKLQAQFVIHGNVKTYSSDRPQKSIASLRSVVRKALEECDRRSLQSIAFPAIGIGNLSFPPDVAIQALVGSAVDYLVTNWSATNIRKVILVGFEDTARTLFHSTIEQQCGLDLGSAVAGRWNSAGGLHPTSVVPGQSRRADSHSTSGIVPDYPDLKLPTLQLDPPPRGTRPLGTPLQFSILAESNDLCSQAEAELQQNVDSLLRRGEVADETIEQLPTNFMTAFLVSAEAAHVQVTISHNPALVELCGPKEDVDKAVDTLRTALLVLSNRLQTIDMQISDELRNYQWMYTCGSGGVAMPFSQEECYELEMAVRLQRNTVTLDGLQGGQRTFNMERLVEVAAGATRPMRISRVRKEEGFPRPETWEGQDNVVEVKRNSQEFSQVVTEFERSVRYNAIVKIERIQNNRLWQTYQAHKQEVSRDTPRGTQAERMLYHGCPSTNVDSINTNGFTPKLAGRVVYGQGVYFAQDASYSAGDHYSTKDKNGHKRIYCCLVLTGVYKKGSSHMKVPPPLSPHTTKWCHSTVDSESNPTIFVIYENNMVYPQSQCCPLGILPSSTAATSHCSLLVVTCGWRDMQDGKTFDIRVPPFTLYRHEGSKT